ncbi:RNA 2',3'-cyclic phosphodiesterase [Rubrobacter marinus]|uniref:RNA 2',3'-cyclic phosphodiesterase n=1 Tax=Rubrobacter marinus TaxID=2653852 RepID=UPI00389B34A8
MALAAAREAARELGGGIRWTKQENIHLTLKFLGEVFEESLEGICGALRRACSAHAPFDARLKGLGAFPSPRRARVIWAGVDRGSEETTSLAASVEAALEPLGFRREGRPYMPHATLGRARGRSVGVDLSKTDVLDSPLFRVASAELTKSTLTPGGSVYEIVEAFALNGEEGDYSR